jgi:hypothetical protein
MNVACECNEWPPDEPQRVLGEYAGQRITLGAPMNVRVIAPDRPAIMRR